MFKMGPHGGVVVSTVASKQEGSLFESGLGHFCVEFACPPCAFKQLYGTQKFWKAVKN